MKQCLPHAVTIKLLPREDGGLRVCSDDVIGLVLSHSDPEKVLLDLLPAIRGILGHPKSLEQKFEEMAGRPVSGRL